jgi:hypothetical protein
MNKMLLDSWNNLLRLMRFLFWYGLAVAVLLFVMPSVGVFVEHHYDALSSTVKFFSVLGVLAVIATWHAVTRCGNR